MEEIQQETKPQEPNTGQTDKSKIILETIIITISILGILTLVFLGMQDYWKNKANVGTLEQSQLQTENEVLNDSTYQEVPQQQNAELPLNDNRVEIEKKDFEADKYDGWNTYTNEIGYKIRYPKDWTIEVTNEYSDLIQEKVKYIVIFSPGKKYSLYWGLMKNTDSFAISDRTGVGAGELVKDGNITILGTDVTINKLSYEGKTMEYFFPNPITGKTADGKYTYGASFDAEGKSIPANSEEFTTAKKILESAELLIN